MGVDFKADIFSHRAGRRTALFGGTILATVLASILITISAKAETHFTSCRTPKVTAKTTTEKSVTHTSTDAHCSVAQHNALSSLAALSTHGPSIASHLEVTKKEMKHTQDFDRSLQEKVVKHLDDAILKYDRLAQCEAPCRIEEKATADTSDSYNALRLELALMEPDDITTKARQYPASWATDLPRHPFSTAAKLSTLNPDEREATHREFLRRLSEKVPGFSERSEAVLKNKTAIAQTSSEFPRIDAAMIEIRSEARTKYLSMISDNPLLLFLSRDGTRPFTSAHIAEASKKLADEIRSEKNRILALSTVERLDSLIEYSAIAEKILEQNPQFCTTAEKLAEASDSRRTRRQIGLVAGQVSVGITAAFMCGTVVSCGLAATGLATFDYGIASHDATLAFKKGLSQAAISDRKNKGRDTESIMTKADTAAGVQALSLVLGAPLALKSSLDLARKGTALVASARSSGQVATGEVVGSGSGSVKPVAVPTTPLNALHNIVYRDLLKNHEGREREILEIVIERLQNRKMSPDQISKFLQERVRQCSK